MVKKSRCYIFYICELGKLALMENIKLHINTDLNNESFLIHTEFSA